MPKKTVQGMMFEEIKEMHGKIDLILQDKLPKLDTRVSKVEVKSGLWGGLSGLLGGVLIALGFHKG